MLSVPLGCGLVSLPCFLLTSTFTNISARLINGTLTGDNSLAHCATSTTFLLCPPPTRGGFRKYNIITQGFLKNLSRLRVNTPSVWKYPATRNIQEAAGSLLTFSPYMFCTSISFLYQPNLSCGSVEPKQEGHILICHLNLHEALKRAKNNVLFFSMVENKLVSIAKERISIL